MRAELAPGYHVNSNAPSGEYLIPLKLTWNDELMEGAEVIYPEPEMMSFGFSESPLSVYTGDFDLLTQVKIPTDAPAGRRKVTGKLRYQACSDKLCLPPKTISVSVALEIR